MSIKFPIDEAKVQIDASWDDLGIEDMMGDGEPDITKATSQARIPISSARAHTQYKGIPGRHRRALTFYCAMKI